MAYYWEPSEFKVKVKPGIIAKIEQGYRYEWRWRVTQRRTNVELEVSGDAATEKEARDAAESWAGRLAGLELIS